MFFYTSQNKFRFPLEAIKLSEKPQYINQVAVWIENQWGYLRLWPGISAREEIVRSLEDNLYLVFYDKIPVGMFALFEKTRHPTARELMYVYVDDSLRDCGVGGALLKLVKEKAREQGATEIELDTLNPKLNTFYTRHGAKIIGEVGESHFRVPVKNVKSNKEEKRDYPVTQLRISLQ